MQRVKASFDPSIQNSFSEIAQIIADHYMRMVDNLISALKSRREFTEK